METEEEHNKDVERQYWLIRFLIEAHNPFAKDILKEWMPANDKKIEPDEKGQVHIVKCEPYHMTNREIVVKAVVKKYLPHIEQENASTI
jgi:hypothetical protein